MGLNQHKEEQLFPLKQYYQAGADSAYTGASMSIRRIKCNRLTFNQFII